MPSTSPSARTDCPSTASRGDGQQTRHESGQPCPMPQESTTRPAPRPDGHAARRLYAASLPAQIEQTELAGEREDIRRGRREARREKGRKDEDLRPLACRFAVKVIYRPNPAPQTASPAPPQASRHPSPHRLKLPVSRRTPARFYLCQFCFWRVCRTPAYFRPSADEQRHPAACLDATGTGGAFTFSRPPRFSRNGLVPLLYHVHPISPFFTREQSRRFPNSK